MSRKVKKAEKSINFHQDELEIKRKKYREWVEKNPYPMDHGIEVKECEGCYCQMFYNSGYDFCSGCLDCERMGCEFGCCDCYSDGSRGWRGGDGKIKKGKFRDKIKKMSFSQIQRLHWEQTKMWVEDMIEEIRDHEDTNDMLTAKKIEDVKRWSRQEKERILESLTVAELYQEIEKKESLHKKEVINCYGCKQKTNQWKFNDLEQRFCPSCKEKEDKWLEPYQSEKYLNEKEKKGCYRWCADDCPQQVRPEKKSKKNSTKTKLV